MMTTEEKKSLAAKIKELREKLKTKYGIWGIGQDQDLALGQLFCQKLVSGRESLPDINFWQRIPARN